MDYLAVIAAEGERVVRRARRGRLDARIPYLETWTMSDVVAHLGAVHRWAAGVVASRNFERRSRRNRTETGETLIAWFDEGVGQLVATLAAADPADKCGNFSPANPQTVGFWYRRQAHETTIHRWDVEAAAGEHDPIDAAFAADGIDELFHTFTRVRGNQVLDAPIRIEATDIPRSWVVRPADRPGRVDVVSDQGQAAATLSGPAEQVLLALWKRMPLDEAAVQIGGSEEKVRKFVAGPITA